MIGVLNTRPAALQGDGMGGEGESASTLDVALRAAGYSPIDVPLVELVLLPGALAALRKLSPDHYDGILFTSPNLLPLLRSAGESIPEAWRSKPWFLVGGRARAEVEALGVKVAFVPHEASLDGFLRELPAEFSGLRLLHPCSAKTRLDPALFVTKGIKAHNMAVYEPRLPEGADIALEAAWPSIAAGGAILLASGSAVHHLFVAAPRLARTLSDDAGPVPISIGASTSRALRMYGVHRFTQAPTADTAGFVAALQTVFSKEPS